MAHVAEFLCGKPCRSAELNPSMTLRRALVTAPLAVLVAILTHAAVFAGGHALGGTHGSALLSVAVGGLLFVALAAFLRLAIAEPDARRGERWLRTLLPAGGRTVRTASVLLGTGFVAFAAIELAEGHTMLAPAALGWLAAVSLAVAAVVRIAARWIAAAGALVAASSLTAAQTIAPALPLALSRFFFANSFERAGARLGRAPPVTA